MGYYSYDIKDYDAGGRIGQLKLGDKILDTPNLFPVVNPFRNSISPRRLYDHFGAQCLFTNAYIIYKNRENNPGIISKKLHEHLDFPGIIATDSGGFQDYMYAGDIKLTPEEIEPFQENLGSDCPVILDIPVQTTDSYEEAKWKVDVTLKRAEENIQRRTRTDTAWFGPIHGSIYPDLLKRSALGMSKYDYGIYAIGGIVKTFIDYRFDLDVAILLEVRKWLRADRPLHMFGLGLPAFFSLAVACGADTFDSAAYILYAKDDRYFTLTGTRNINDLIELPCHCPICTSFSANELKKLPKQERITAIAEHNLYHSYSELKAIKQAIHEGSLWDLVEHRVHAHPKLIKALKKTQEYPDYFDGMINLNKTRGQKYLTSFSFHRAHIRRYRNKVSHFKIPKDRNTVIVLPELDLPSSNGISVIEWIKELKNMESYEKKQIAIMSNLMGFIPLELSEMFPAGQHEGSGDISENNSHKKIILEELIKMLSINVKTVDSIQILIPKEFISEYNEVEPFDPFSHIISCIEPAIQERFSGINVAIFNSIEELING
ncbi:tRNA guanosine(15) transglycosylase TgtA [Candidatus Lokiarchaeum ossiferum]|uniref:tRNA guanosine(15) transglycosylase TgtA n=1 Tax=Candidatus Lokiarchaeum ossiferum TaxID=2951803 RepID=UPI00352CB3FD